MIINNIDSIFVFQFAFACSAFILLQLLGNIMDGYHLGGLIAICKPSYVP